jgi:hypothetical protein
MQVNYPALELLATKNANKIVLKKEDQDYFYSVGVYQFIIVKQPKHGTIKGGYSVDCYKWINNGIHQQNVEFSQETMSLTEVKKAIVLFLFAHSVSNALKTIYKTNL